MNRDFILAIIFVIVGIILFWHQTFYLGYTFNFSQIFDTTTLHHEQLIVGSFIMAGIFYWAGREGGDEITRDEFP